GRDRGRGRDRRGPKRRVEREVDVVAQEEVARLRGVVEANKAKAAGLRRPEQLDVVIEVEGTSHGNDTLLSVADTFGVHGISLRCCVSRGRVGTRTRRACT